jgi:hypothetical protein
MPSLPLYIKFGTSGDHDLWAKGGWYADEEPAEHTWASEIASLQIALPKQSGDVDLIIEVIPLDKLGKSQKLFVYVNGNFAHFWIVKKTGAYRSCLDPKFLTPGANTITFVMPDAVSPKEEGFGLDDRTLSVAFRSIRLEKAIK